MAEEFLFRGPGSVEAAVGTRTWSRERTRRYGQSVTDPRTLATTYFRAWKDKDFDALRSILADDATFRGPVGSAEDADACVEGLRGMARRTEDITIEKMFVDGDDVLTWYELQLQGAPPLATAKWCHVEGGKIKTIRAVFDPRPVAPPGS